MPTRPLLLSLAVLASLTAATAPGAPAAGLAAGLDPYEALVTRVVKQVEWQRAHTTRWQRAANETLLVVGDTLRTGEAASAELAYGDGSVTRVGSLTSLTLTGERKRELRLDAGRVWLHIQKGGAGMRVITPGAVAAVTGTELMVEFDPVRKLTEVTVFEGAVNVTGDVGDLVRVLGGTTTRVPFRAPAVTPVPLDQRKLEDRDTIFKPLSVKEPASGQTGTSSGSGETQSTGGETKSGNGETKSGSGETKTGTGETGTPVALPDAGTATPPPSAPSPTVAVTPAPAPSAVSPSVSPDLKGQVKGLNDPRLINGSTTTGTVRVIIE